MALSLALKAVSRSGLSSPASRATACHTTVARELLCWFAESYALRFEIEPNKPRFTFGIQEEEPSKPHSAPLAGYMNCICCLAHFELQNVWCSNHKENCRNNPEMTLYVLSLQIIRIKLKPKEHSNVSGHRVTAAKRAKWKTTVDSKILAFRESIINFSYM